MPASTLGALVCCTVTGRFQLMIIADEVFILTISMDVSNDDNDDNEKYDNLDQYVKLANSINT